MTSEATSVNSASASVGNEPVSLLIATRKGGFILDGGRDRANWQLRGPFYLGSEVNHLILDPRDQRTLVMAARRGHLGPTIFRSTDVGATWNEAEQPPAFPKATDDAPGRTVHHNSWLTPGHASEPDVWYIGTSPVPIQVSVDGCPGVDGGSEFLTISGTPGGAGATNRRGAGIGRRRDPRPGVCQPGDRLG